MISELISLVNQGCLQLGHSEEGNYQLCKPGLGLLIYSVYSLIDSLLSLLQHFLIGSSLQPFKDLQDQLVCHRYPRKAHNNNINKQDIHHHRY